VCCHFSIMNRFPLNYPLPPSIFFSTLPPVSPPFARSCVTISFERSRAACSFHGLELCIVWGVGGGGPVWGGGWGGGCGVVGVGSGGWWGGGGGGGVGGGFFPPKLCIYLTRYPFPQMKPFPWALFGIRLSSHLPFSTFVPCPHPASADKVCEYP